MGDFCANEREVLREKRIFTRLFGAEREARDKAVVARHLEGASSFVIGAEFGIDRSRVSQIVRAAGLGKPTTVKDRLLSRYDEVDTGFATPCWSWKGTMDIGGYGVLWKGGRPRKAHRVAYETLIGPIPDGLVIDHLCRHRPCVNPAHMEPVTLTENTRRGIGGGNVYAANRLAATHCTAGHRYSAETIYRAPDGVRHCRVCQAKATRRYRAKKKLAAIFSTTPQVIAAITNSTCPTWETNGGSEPHVAMNAPADFSDSLAPFHGVNNG